MNRTALVGTYIIFFVLVSLDKEASAADLQPTRTSTPTTDKDLFSDVRSPRDPGFEIERLLLSLPGSVVELAFVPISLALATLERYAILERAFDLFTNDELTFAALPIVEPFSASGLGLGLVVAWNDPLGSPDRVIFVLLSRLNGDRQVSLSIGRRVPPLSGRALEFSTEYSSDRDIGWFGLGSDQTVSAQRLLRIDQAAGFVGLSELFPQVINLDGSARLGFRSVGIFEGTGSRAPTFVPGGSIAAPPGFDETINYVEAQLQFRYDTRDGIARTTRGIVWSLDGQVSTEVLGDNTNPSGGLRGTTQFAWFLPVLPRNRVLVLNAGLSAATPIIDDGEVALHQLVRLGGANTLRGYQPDRFIDSLGWWASAEYRFLLSDYGGSILGFSGSIFADIGRADDRISDLFRGPIPWSVGLGLRAETDFLLLGRVQVGFSPDGVQFTVGFGESF